MVLRTLIVTIVFSTFALQCSENSITVRPANLHDLDAIFEFNQSCFPKDFKPIVARTVTTEQKVDCFMDELTKRHNNWCHEFITKQLNQEDYSVLIAHQTSIEKESSLIGYCRFYKKNAHTIQIGFLGVDELFRKQGIAKALAFAAMNRFDGITECIFRTFSNYDFITEIYKNHNCIITGNAYLNPDTLEWSMDSIDPTLIPFNDYSYTIKK